jgi:hypothetical protein
MLCAPSGDRLSESTVDQFVQCVGLYPVGTLVELNTGEVAVVVAQNRIRRLAGDDPARARQEAQQYPHTLDLSTTGRPPPGRPTRLFGPCLQVPSVSIRRSSTWHDRTPFFGVRLAAPSMRTFWPACCCAMVSARASRRLSAFGRIVTADELAAILLERLHLGRATLPTLRLRRSA